MRPRSARHAKRRPRVQPWTVVLAVVILGLVLAMVAAGCRRGRQPPAPAEPPLAQLVQVSGGVTVTPGAGGAARQAAPGPLFRGDLVATDGTGRAVLQLKDGRQIEVEAGARFKVGEQQGEITLELLDGILISHPASGDAAAVRLAVLTPFGLVRFPSATSEAQVGVSSAGARIEVSLGEITIAGQDGGIQTARAGERVALSLGAIEIVRPPKEPSPEPEAARVVELPSFDVLLGPERGTLMVRRPGQATFVPTKQKLAALDGTVFKVPAGATGRVLAGGLDARLGSGVRGGLGKAQRLPDGERLELSLASGSTTVLFRGGQELAIAGKAGTVTVRARGRATAKIVGSAHGHRIESQAGELEIEAPGGTERLRPGRTADLARGRLRVSSGGRAGFALPPARGLRVYGERFGEVALTWPDEVKEGVIEVATDAGFQHTVAAGRVWGTFLNVSPPARGDLHWRVLGADGKPRYRGQARFEPDAGKSVLDLANPHSVVKETGLRATVYFQSVMPSISLVWNPQAKVGRYRVRVYSADNLSKAKVERFVEDTRCDLEPGVLTEGSYVWGATGLTPEGREYSGGRMNKLDVVYDNSMTTLAIARPKPGQVLHGPQVDVQGVAPLQSKLTINGAPAPLDAKGRFNLKVPYAEILVFHMTDRAGVESYWLRTAKGRP